MYKRVINLIIVAILATLLFSACNALDKPVPSQAAEVTLSSHVVSINSYEIPKGIFRGVLWPNKDNHDFQVWVINGSKEIFFKVPAPSELVTEIKEVTNDWIIKKIGVTKDKIAYSAVRNDDTKSLQFELPVKKSDYSFTVLSNSSGGEVILFMNTAENIVDNGLFGYIVISK